MSVTSKDYGSDSPLSFPLLQDGSARTRAEPGRCDVVEGSGLAQRVHGRRDLGGQRAVLGQHQTPFVAHALIGGELTEQLAALEAEKRGLPTAASVSA